MDEKDIIYEVRIEGLKRGELL